ncbi:hypothetical protein CO112_04140 [Candidatus Dojkabacteria bacterium CG_4_9_14_3_um_filter_150_Dojkabacteria_WS6_41_13]|uniref:Cytochrome b5 heme-binding domain-containing protein n=1 Tax=Candidatus Dojkabacteria bacterium CG_4_10_14_0_2_um_filter_Dojkabacteria_WS6_41_15 TaxID=2014249 RepID=A0A2M7W2E9_9BACT|nr:MAG: hypothetical protein COX64_01640 [Candidatus Dojkabacteria bacterium CG_4_10_14_0_2_um_filter_Dojkabacteria_WS6_41_15]PJB22501.1 MAG: hypothetical protein CO112_04140 [Candidatus Dojkabacteria bacterium CG_4_9_14_3_um_filter_150_Dojkabacteria_WS6_41_13]
MKGRKIPILIGVAIGLLILGTFGYAKWHSAKSASNTPTTAETASLKEFTVAVLAQYDGTDSSKPIYLAMNGLVYDVTTGKQYYEKGGTYHWLAGKDSSTDLNLIGGDIIKRKYPVIGKLVQ